MRISYNPLWKMLIDRGTVSYTHLNKLADKTAFRVQLIQLCVEGIKTVSYTHLSSAASSGGVHFVDSSINV